jgi:hypothetical protein
LYALLDYTCLTPIPLAQPIFWRSATHPCAERAEVINLLPHISAPLKSLQNLISIMKIIVIHRLKGYSKFNPSILIDPLPHRQQLATSATKIHNIHAEMLHQKPLDKQPILNFRI